MDDDAGARQADRRGFILILSSPSGAGQDHADAHAVDQGGARPHPVDLRDHARSRRPQRGGRRPLQLHQQAHLPGAARRRRPARMGRGARQLLRHAALAGGTRPGTGPRRAVRHRLAGHATGQGQGRHGCGDGVHPAADHGRAAAAAGWSAAPRIHRRRSPSGSPTRGSRSAGGRSTITCSSTTTSR